MNREDDEARCRARAYELREAAGCPENRDLEHWTLAQAELDGSIDLAPPSPSVHDEASGIAAHQATDGTTAR